MVSKWAVTNPLTIGERQIIEQGIKNNLSYRQIAELVGRAKTTVMREAKRLGDVHLYSAEKAQEDFEMKQINKVPLISIGLKRNWEKRKRLKGK